MSVSVSLETSTVSLEVISSSDLLLFAMSASLRPSDFAGIGRRTLVKHKPIHKRKTTYPNGATIGTIISSLLKTARAPLFNN